MTQTSSLTPAAIDPLLMQILRCPVTHSRLRQEGDVLISETGGLRYPIREGIPVLLPEEAELPPDVPSLEVFRQRFAPAKP